MKNETKPEKDSETTTVAPKIKNDTLTAPKEAKENATAAPKEETTSSPSTEAPQRYLFRVLVNKKTCINFLFTRSKSTLLLSGLIIFN